MFDYFSELLRQFISVPLKPALNETGHHWLEKSIKNTNSAA